MGRVFLPHWFREKTAIHVRNSSVNVHQSSVIEEIESKHLKTIQNPHAPWEYLYLHFIINLSHINDREIFAVPKLFPHLFFFFGPNPSPQQPEIRIPNPNKKTLASENSNSNDSPRRTGADDTKCERSHWCLAISPQQGRNDRFTTPRFGHIHSPFRNFSEAGKQRHEKTRRFRVVSVKHEGEVVLGEMGGGFFLVFSTSNPWNYRTLVMDLLRSRNSSFGRTCFFQ